MNSRSALPNTTIASVPDLSEPPLHSTQPHAQQARALAAEWRDYYRHANEDPPYPAARDFLHKDILDAMRRLIPEDATLLEVGAGSGKLLEALPNRVKVGLDYLPERVAQAQREHPDIAFQLADATEPRDPSGPEHLGRGQPARFDAIICDRLCHSVVDIRTLLEGLRSRLAPGGRIYLTVFNYLWELPSRVAEQTGWKRPAPTSNWLSDFDLGNLFEIVGLEVVRYEDRLLVPVDLAGLSSLLNRYVVRLPVLQRLSLYRVYVLRDRGVPSPQCAATVSIVVPARNESGNVQAVIDRTPLLGAGTELIFVEGGSSDGTWDTIQNALASYRGPLRLHAYRQSGRGKGDAVRLGFSKASGDLLMILDADLTVPPEELSSFYEVVVRGQADYVQGTRLVYPMDKHAMRFFNKLGNVAFSWLFSYLLQQPIRDTLCGTKVLWRRDYERLAAARHYFGDFDPFGDFDLIFGAARLNLKIAEIPIRYRERTYGETNISRWKHGLLLLKMSTIAARKLRFV